MDLSHMNRGCCGNSMQNRRPVSIRSESASSPCSSKPAPQTALAMAYIPMQRFEQVYDLSMALMHGTLFPDLCKPFCGKGGGQCL